MVPAAEHLLQQEEGHLLQPAEEVQLPVSKCVNAPRVVRVRPTFAIQEEGRYAVSVEKLRGVKVQAAKVKITGLAQTDIAVPVSFFYNKY